MQNEDMDKVPHKPDCVARQEDTSALTYHFGKANLTSIRQWNRDVVGPLTKALLEENNLGQLLETVPK